MVGGVAGRRQRPQAAVLLAVAGQHHLGAEPLRPVRVVAVAVRQQDEADPAALLGRGAHRVEMPASSGPGSITAHGPDPYR